MVLAHVLQLTYSVVTAENLAQKYGITRDQCDGGYLSNNALRIAAEADQMTLSFRPAISTAMGRRTRSRGLCRRIHSRHVATQKGSTSITRGRRAPSTSDNASIPRIAQTRVHQGRWDRHCRQRQWYL
jgi:hypothetical protein